MFSKLTLCIGALSMPGNWIFSAYTIRSYDNLRHAGLATISNQAGFSKFKDTKEHLTWMNFTGVSEPIGTPPSSFWQNLNILL